MANLSLSQRIERFSARALLNMHPAALRILAGKPVVRDGQTLDPQLQLMLRLQKLRGKAALGATTPAEERRMMNAQTRVLEPVGPDLAKVEDISLAGGVDPVPARVYYPDGLRQPAPAMVFYHGGGFVIGSLDSHDGPCRVIAAKAQCIVISVDYRLAPEHRAPAGVGDAIAAFRDIAARADEFGIDSKRIAVSGDSAGGNLAAVVAQNTADDTVSPCFQLLFYPTVDFARDSASVLSLAEGFLLEKSSMDWFRGHYIDDATNTADPMVSPIYGDVTGVAPAFVITAGFDPLRDEGEAYARKLMDAGVATQQERYPSMIHGFLNVAGAVDGARQALDDAIAALRKAFEAR